MGNSGNTAQQGNESVILYVHGGTVFRSRQEFLEWLENSEIDTNRQETWADKLRQWDNVIAPRFPCRENARYREWEILFSKYMDALKNKRVVLVGYSLGAAFLAKYFGANRVPGNVVSVNLVGLPIDDANGEHIGDFKPDIRLLSKIRNLRVFLSESDPFTPEEHRNTIVRHLGNRVILLDKNGHFRVPDFPELFSAIMKDIGTQRDGGNGERA